MDVVERLRQAREDQGLGLDTLERRTRVRVHLLEAVEQGRFDKLPRGVYARAIIRAYATAVGVDPNRATADVASRLPDVEDPIDGIARVRGIKRSGAGASPDAAGTQHVHHSQQVEHSHQVEWHLPPGTEQQQRAAVAAIDGALLTAIQGALVALTALTAGVSVTNLLEFATPALVMLFVVISGLYFVLLGGVAGATIGARVMRCGRPERLAVSPSAVLLRAGCAAARELSILMDVFLQYFGHSVRLKADSTGTRTDFAQLRKRGVSGLLALRND